jgi:hypothetical protein
MVNHTLTLLEVALLLVASLLVVVFALRVFYQDAYERASTEGARDTGADEPGFTGDADWLGMETRWVLAELGIRDLRRVAKLTPLQIHAIESRLAFGTGRVKREQWIERARQAIGKEGS